MTYDLSQLENAPAPTANHDVYTPNAELRKMQRRMAALYRRQKEKGGIIDVEAESNKFLIDISQVTFPITNITCQRCCFCDNEGKRIKIVIESSIPQLLHFLHMILAAENLTLNLKSCLLIQSKCSR